MTDGFSSLRVQIMRMSSVFIHGYINKQLLAVKGLGRNEGKPTRLGPSYLVKLLSIDVFVVPCENNWEHFMKICIPISWHNSWGLPKKEGYPLVKTRLKTLAIDIALWEGGALPY
jgi:hypothetical protein